MEPKILNYNNDKRYVVTPEGEVIDLKKCKIKKTYLNSAGYKTVNIYLPGLDSRHLVHRLVAEAFIPNPENKPEVNHIDGNKLNNHYTNLEWVTHIENNLHYNRLGLRKSVSGEDVHFAKYTTMQIEAACSEMEKDELSLLDIELITGVPCKTLSEIRSGNIWKDISKKFKFPKTPLIASRIGLKYTDVKLLIDLSINTDLKPKRICEIMNIDNNQKIRKAINWHRNKHKKMINVQRPSKTLEEILNNIPQYDEEFLFGWERGSE